MLVGHTTSAGDLQVYTGYLPKKTCRSCTCSSGSKLSHGSKQIRVAVAGTHRLLASPSRLVFWSNKAGYFEILKW